MALHEMNEISLKLNKCSFWSTVWIEIQISHHKDDSESTPSAEGHLREEDRKKKLGIKNLKNVTRWT